MYILPSDDDGGDISEIFFTPVDEQLAKNKIDIVKRNFFVILFTVSIEYRLINTAIRLKQQGSR
jgi:hypothetical protein